MSVFVAPQVSVFVPVNLYQYKSTNADTDADLLAEASGDAQRNCKVFTTQFT